MRTRNTRSILIVIILVALILPCWTISVSAAYENTYTNTGNMADDIIGVALTQVGYSEGSNNYTKYGVWYGQPNSPWCGMFVSWCAKEAEIPTSILKRTGLANPSNFGLSYKDGASYTPQKGDLFFKKNFGHVGLVYYTEGDYFYTVEGNTSTTSSEGTSVMIRRRKISDFYFSSPAYEGTSSSGCDHEYTVKYDTAHPHKEYKVCSICGRKSYTGNKKTVDDCKTCIQAACSHTFEDWEKTSDSKHGRVCSKCGKTESASHKWVNGEIIKEPTCKDDGLRAVTCSVCDAESTKEIPATGEHTYSDYTYIDESTHQKVCSGCGETDTGKHTVSSGWGHDVLYHWSSCKDCGGRIGHSEHIFRDGCLSPCSVCGYTSDFGHKLSDTFQFDSEKHWHVCERCNLEAEVQEHRYTSDCDETCNDCGYVRDTAIAHTDVCRSDEAGHWYLCTTCGKTTDPVSHTPNSESSEWENLVCSECDYLLRSAEDHVHEFHSVEFDETTHWGKCICGEELSAEAHTWDFQTGECSICHAHLENAEEKPPFHFLVEFWNFILGILKIGS